MHPPEEWAMAPPGERFGTDVLAKIGLLHFRDKLTRAAIGKRLFDEDGLQISERQVNRYFNLYGALVAQQNLKDKKLIRALKNNRLMVLSLDAAKPMKGHDLIWFVRELLTGRTLVARAMSTSTEEDLVELLKPVREFAKRIGVAVTGIVSDAEKNIRAAVRAVFPRVRHQLCQLHYVGNLSEPLESKDVELRETLRKPFRELRDVQRGLAIAHKEAGCLSDDEANILAELAFTIQSILTDSGKLPFEPPGLKLYDALKDLKESATRMSREKGGPC
jgi:hypothetical protein